MRFRSLLSLVLCLEAAPLPMSGAQTARAVDLRAVEERDRTAAFDVTQSAGLFVGVREFTHDADLVVVPYAVDDAVDLAYAVSMDRPLPLVLPSRIALALAGDPQKPSSRDRLRRLRAAGASVHPAGQSDLLVLLERQSRAAGTAGMLIVSMATHGFTVDGDHYLLAANSLRSHRQTALLLSDVFDIVAASDARRSLMFIDACRRRMTSVARGETDPASTAPELPRASSTLGHVIFHAAAPGQYAYDDEQRGNGVFTAAVIDGMRCSAPANASGIVTVASLAGYVDGRVTEWVRKHRDGHGATGIQVTTDSGAQSIPVAVCNATRGAASNFVKTDFGDLLDRAEALVDQDPAMLRIVENSFHVLSAAGVRLWGGSVSGAIAHAELVDLDGDKHMEVVVGVGGAGTDSGKVIVFDSGGAVRWSRDTKGALNYGAGRSGQMAVKTLTTGDLYRSGTRQIVALSIDAQGWYPSRLTVFDRDGSLVSSYWHPGHLHHVVIAAPTASAEPRIIVAAVNNDLRKVLQAGGYVTGIFALDPKRIDGEAPPYGGRAVHGTQLWYGVVLPAPDPVEKMEIVDTNQDGVSEISIWCASQNVFYVSLDGRLVSRARGDGAKTDASFFLLREP